MSGLNEKAQRLRELHEKPTLVLANAWDAASAAIVLAAGAPAIATTSSGCSWSYGRPDGERLTRDQMAGIVRRVVSTVDVPVTADMESGYGPAPGDVAATVQAVLEAGAVGMNLEDSRPTDDSLYTVDDQVARVRAAYEAAVAAGVPEFVVNARTDVYLSGRRDFAEARDRLAAYAEAGAGCLFVPGLLDLELLGRLAAELPRPLNALTGPGRPSVAELAAVGVRRVSIGGTLARIAYSAARLAAEELFSTGASSAVGLYSHNEMDALFT